MDPVVIAAYRAVAVAHHASVDDIVTDPAVRSAFLAECRAALGEGPTERSLLRLLLTLRKRSKLPRSRELLENPTAAV